MTPREAKALIKKQLEKGWVQQGSCIYTPQQAQSLGITKSKKQRATLPAVRTWWTDDAVNLRSRERYADTFDRLVKIELGLDVWPEFRFSAQKAYRIDKAIPVDAQGNVLKIAVEVNGGIWAKGNSGHSSGKGIRRDMDKANLLAATGWTLISVEPVDIEKYPGRVLELIRQMAAVKSGTKSIELPKD